MGKFSACALLELVKALNKVDLPTFGSPTIPHLKPIFNYLSYLKINRVFFLLINSNIQLFFLKFHQVEFFHPH